MQCANCILTNCIWQFRKKERNFICALPKNSIRFKIGLGRVECGNSRRTTKHFKTVSFQKLFLFFLSAVLLCLCLFLFIPFLSHFQPRKKEKKLFSSFQCLTLYEKLNTKFIILGVWEIYALIMKTFFGSSFEKIFFSLNSCLAVASWKQKLFGAKIDVKNFCFSKLKIMPLKKIQQRPLWKYKLKLVG